MSNCIFIGIIYCLNDREDRISTSVFWGTLYNQETNKCLLHSCILYSHYDWVMCVPQTSLKGTIMAVDLKKVQFLTEHIELINHHRENVEPSMLYLVDGFPNQPGIPVTLDLTVKDHREFMSKLDSDLFKYLMGNDRLPEMKEGHCHPRITDNDLDQFFRFSEWMKEVCTQLREAYPEEDSWDACLALKP